MVQLPFNPSEIELLAHSKPLICMGSWSGSSTPSRPSPFTEAQASNVASEPHREGPPASSSPTQKATDLELQTGSWRWHQQEGAHRRFHQRLAETHML